MINKQKKISVLIADNSALVRVALSNLLNSDSEITVIAVAKTGTETISKATKLDPDVIIIDVTDLPESEGTTTVKKIIEQRKIPIIINSVPSTSHDDATLLALGSGAVDFIIKQKNSTQYENVEYKNEIIAKVKAAAKAKISSDEKNIEQVKVSFKKRFGKKIIAIGSSTGGPQTLEQILPLLPKDIPCPILIVQHMPPVFTKGLAERLNSFSEIKIKEAEDNEELKNGTAYIAPGDFHMTIKEDGYKIRISLDQRPRELGVRPCANFLFESVVEIFGENTIAVILTGMGTDGTIGCRKIKENNGTVLVESEKSSIIFGMPKSVIESGYYDEILDLEKIPVGIVQLLEV